MSAVGPALDTRSRQNGTAESGVRYWGCRVVLPRVAPGERAILVAYRPPPNRAWRPVSEPSLARSGGTIRARAAPQRGMSDSRGACDERCLSGAVLGRLSRPLAEPPA